MPMKRETAKIAALEVVDALKCILEAQTGRRSEFECSSIVKKPIHRFCEIARDTERKIQKEEAEERDRIPEIHRYDISRFLGADATARKKMGLVCSTKREYPACDEAEKYAGEGHSWEEYIRHLPPCGAEVKEAIKIRPIEKTDSFKTLTSSFETMRDWMHVSGYAVPDYVWSVPLNMREKTKKLFAYLSSEKVTSPEDLEKKKREIEKW